jgi:hypothetical protein
MSRLNVNQHSIDEYCWLLCFTLQFIIENMLIPGQVESWVVITDLCNIGMRNLPLKDLKKLITCLQDNFRNRMHINYVVNAPTTFVFIWRMVKGMLEQNTVKKIRIMKQSVIDELTTHFNTGQYEINYGGKAPNAETFWPPNMPQGPWNSKNENSEKFLTQHSSYNEYFPEPHQNTTIESVPDKKKKKKRRRMDSGDTAETMTPLTSNKTELPERANSAENLPKIAETSIEDDSRLVLMEVNAAPASDDDSKERRRHKRSKRSHKSKKSRSHKREADREEYENIQENEGDSYSMHEVHHALPAKKKSLSHKHVNPDYSQEFEPDISITEDELHKADSQAPVHLKSSDSETHLMDHGEIDDISSSKSDNPRVITDTQFESAEERSLSGGSGLLCGGCFSGKTMSCIVF